MVSPKGRQWLYDYEKDGKVILELPAFWKDKEKEVKKTISIENTLSMLKEGKSIEGISKEVGVGGPIIENHICLMYKKGYDIDLESLGFTDDIYHLVNEVIEEIGIVNKLEVIKKGLPKNVTYLHIKLAIVKRGLEEGSYDSSDGSC